jgi:type I restriction enzyme, S subunit
MMTNHKEHQTSNLLWFGDIPSHWKAKRFKYLTKSRKELSKNGKEELLSVTEVRGIIKRRELKSDDENLSRSEDLTGYRHVKKGDLVSNIMLVWKRGLGVSPYNGIVSPAYSVFNFSSECHPDFYNYLVRSDEYITEFRKHSTGITMSRLRLYDDSFGAVLAHVPPIEEQKLISRYLDKKIDQIDKLIEKIQLKIHLLDEKHT